MKNKLQNFASLLAVIFFLFIAFGSGDSESDKKDNTSTETKGSTEETGEPEAVENWKYKVTEDEMSGQKKYFISTKSTNEVEFDFPYDGGSTFTLAVRNYGTENDVVLAVSKGQFMTSIGSDDEYVRIKFDEEELITYPYSSSTTGESDLIFISHESEIIEKLKTAKTVKVDAPFYQAGRQIAKFDVEGFTWEH